MKFLSAAQGKAYKAALKHRYKAVAFDIDGTLTEFSRWTVPESLCTVLNNLPPEVPLALCTGRSKPDIDKKIDHIFKNSSNPEVQRKRWHLLAENGGAGYSWNPRKKDYDCFMEVAWPNSVITPEILAAFITDKLGWNAIPLIKPHSMVVRFHDWVYVLPRITHLVSHRTAQKLKKLMKSMDLEDVLEVQDSGVGNLILPRESGKGKAIARWAKHIKIPLKDILVIGDQAQSGGNDEEFLCGLYGTSFTVGRQTDKPCPFPVLDEKGRKLWGPRGTEWLLRRLF